MGLYLSHLGFSTICLSVFHQSERLISLVLFFAYSRADVFYLQCMYHVSHVRISKGNLIKSELEL